MIRPGIEHHELTCRRNGCEHDLEAALPAVIDEECDRFHLRWEREHLKVS